MQRNANLNLNAKTKVKSTFESFGSPLTHLLSSCQFWNLDSQPSVSAPPPALSSPFCVRRSKLLHLPVLSLSLSLRLRLGVSPGPPG